MKPKTSPTSPKANGRRTEDIAALYQQQLETIDRPKRNRSFIALGVVLAVLFGFAAGIIANITMASLGVDSPLLQRLGFRPSVTTPSVIWSRQSSDELRAEHFEAVSAAAASVVSVYEQKAPAEGALPHYLPHERVGEGMILSQDGTIVTLASVFEPYREYVVVTATGDVYPVETAIKDPVSPYAFVSIDADGLAAVELADPSKLVVGDAVYGLSLKPGQLRHATIPTTVVDADARVPDDGIVEFTEEITTALTLAPLPASFTGSVVMTGSGQALGIVQEADDIEYVIPVRVLDPVMSQFFSERKVERSYLGVTFVDLRRGVPIATVVSDSADAGVLIYSEDEAARPSVVPASPALRAGLREGDTITAVDGIALNGTVNFTELLQRHRPDELVTFSILRNGKPDSITVTLETYQ